jgi:cell division protein FtsQ
MQRSSVAGVGRPLTDPARRGSTPARRRHGSREVGSLERVGAAWRSLRSRRLRARARAKTPLATHRGRVRVWLAALVVLLGLAAGAWQLLRHSSLVALEHVRVIAIGTRGPQARAIDEALQRSARTMTTLDVSAPALRAAVRRFATVRSLAAHASIPHTLTIDVLEQPPVATASVGGARSAVAADGVVLGPGLATGALPVVSAGRSARALPPAGRRVTSRALRGQLAVLGAAPAALARLVSRAYSGPRGVTVVLGSHLSAYFGDATRPHAKWASLARVLADPSSTGAAYIDVRVPERPAAGFPAGTGAPSAQPAEVQPAEAQPAAGAEPSLTGEASSGSEAPAGSEAASAAQPEAASPAASETHP